MTNREYPNRPIVGLGAVVLGPAGVLLIKRGKPPRAGSWSLPGGAQELGETTREGIFREVKEETGLEVEVFHLIDVIDSINCDSNGRAQYHYTLIDVAAVVTGGTLQPGSDAMDARWFLDHEIQTLNLWSETERIIARGLELYQARAI